MANEHPDRDLRRRPDPRHDRRQVLRGLAAGAAALPVLGPRAFASSASDVESCGRGPELFTDAVLVDQEGRKGRFWSDFLDQRTVLIHFSSVAREAQEPAAARLAAVQPFLGERLGRDVFLYTVTSEPERDGPHELAALAGRLGAGPGWRFLTGEPAAVAAVKARLFFTAEEHPAAHHHGEDCSLGLARYGNATAGLWGSVALIADPEWIAERLFWVCRGDTPTGPPRRRGPRPLTTGTPRTGELRTSALNTGVERS